MELTLTSERKNIPAVIALVERELDRMGCPRRTKMQIDIAVDEVFGNIAAYAYGEGIGPVTVRIEEGETPGAAAISFLDEGRPFNPLEHEDPDVSLSARERSIGGLGIYMVKKRMDGVRYEYRDGKNVLTIWKTLQRQE